VASEKALDGDIFVEIWPMNAFATADKTPVLARFLRSISQSREPLNRNRQIAPILQDDPQH